MVIMKLFFQNKLNSEKQKESVCVLFLINKRKYSNLGDILKTQI
jgi:hypothetical protein